MLEYLDSDNEYNIYLVVGIAFGIYDNICLKTTV